MPACDWNLVREVPIGRHMPHVVEHIAESGELLIGGPSLALGYLNLPDLSAERFALLDLGAGMQRYYRSGDRVGRTAGGDLVHQGRLDNQLKVRGIRVDPSEVESEICTHPDVGVVAVVGVETADHTSMTAYVVPLSMRKADTLGADLFGYLRAKLPAHLVPAQINIVPELVYTSSGKVDRAGSHRRHAIQVKKDGLNEC
jgi:nonribosomal peptide synthetase protein VioO